MIRQKLVIMASGSGSNAESIMRWAQESKVAEVICVICDKKDAQVLERAKKFNVPGILVRKKKTDTKKSFDQKLLAVLNDYRPDWIILAGYMRILTPDFLRIFKNKVVNIHPSLLPLFPGLDGYGEAYRANVSESGCTIHFVDEGIDTGKIIDQKIFPKHKGESLEDFKKRGLAIENQFYPEVLEKLLAGKYKD